MFVVLRVVPVNYSTPEILDRKVTPSQNLFVPQVQGIRANFVHTFKEVLRGFKAERFWEISLKDKTYVKLALPKGCDY